MVVFASAYDVVERRVLLTVSSESYSDRHLEAFPVLFPRLIQGRWFRVAIKIDMCCLGIERSSNIVLGSELSEVVREGLSRERKRSERQPSTSLAG